MKATKHTAGPWDEVDLFIVTASDSVICKLGGWDEEYADEQAANAKLIAAAPDLLIWLSWALKMLPTDEQKDTWQFEQARAAVAKATGETP